MKRSHGAGFTLVEMLAVMGILSVLAMAVMPLAEVAVTRQKEREFRQALWQIREAIDAYKKAVDEGRIARATSSGYPPSLVVLAEGVPAARSGEGTVYFLRRVPDDPFGAEGVPARRGWGLRSYESPAENPRAGADVFDVYSLSERVGTNGVPLRAW